MARRTPNGPLSAVAPRHAVWAPGMESPSEAWAAARALEAAARFRGRRRRHAVRSVVHLSPAQFSDESIVGGGERAARDLARAVAALVPTTMVTFGTRRESRRDGDLRVEVYPARRFLNARYDRYDPLGYGHLRELASADVIHCHQYRVAVSQLAILGGAALGRRTFVTDRGGVGCHFDPAIPVARYVDGFLPVSRFSHRNLPEDVATRVIPGGVNPVFVRASDERTPPERRRVLYVGRIMRHKGIDNLVKAVDGVGLDVVGRVYDDRYGDLLRRLAAGKDVRFTHGATDEEVARAYRNALVTVLPSVYRDCFGGTQPMPELLGRVLLESMACGTPVICTSVGGMPEIVRDGENGFVVPPNDPAALRTAIERFVEDPGLADRLGERGRRLVERRFTWRRAAEDTLEAYRELRR